MRKSLHPRQTSLQLCLAQHGLHTDFQRVVLASPHQARGGDSASRQQAFQKLGRRRYAVRCQMLGPGAECAAFVNPLPVFPSGKLCSYLFIVSIYMEDFTWKKNMLIKQCLMPGLASCAFCDTHSHPGARWGASSPLQNSKPFFLTVSFSTEA